MEPASDAWRRGALSFRQRFVDDAVFTLPSGRTVSVCQAAVASKAHAAAVRCDGKAGDGRDDPQLTGGTVWDGAYVLASHLCRRSAWTALRLGLQLEARSALRVLELGAGTGLAGLVAATALDNRCSVTLSDLEGVSKLLAKNVERSGGEKDAATLRVATYAWGDADAAAAMGAPFDCVIGASLLGVFNAKRTRRSSPHWSSHAQVLTWRTGSRTWRRCCADWRSACARGASRCSRSTRATARRRWRRFAAARRRRACAPGKCRRPSWLGVCTRRRSSCLSCGCPGERTAAKEIGGHPVWLASRVGEPRWTNHDRRIKSLPLRTSL